jgi:hypoxanthine phosphoribosyltransferase
LWSYSLDTITPDNLQIIYRSLFHATISLPYNQQEVFTPKDIFLYEKQLYFGKYKTDLVKDIITRLLVKNLWKEGFLTKNSLLLSYPSHKVSSENTAFKPIEGYLTPSLLRWRDTVNKSYLRSIKRHSKITFEEEFNSLVLDCQKSVRDKVIVVLDDFSTTGLSLESARNLLVSGEADKVVLCSIGKFCKNETAKHNIYSIKTKFNPYLKEDKIQKGDYKYISQEMNQNTKIQETLTEYFTHLSKL